MDTTQLDERAPDRVKLLDRNAGRVAAKRILRGAGLGDHPMVRCGSVMGKNPTFRVSAKNGARRLGSTTCQRGRTCQVCGPSKGAERAAEIGTATWRWLAGGEDRTALFVSLNGSHEDGDVLRELGDQLLGARRAVCEGYAWDQVRKRLGIADSLWIMEASVGPNGPHLGLHLVLLLDRWWEWDDAQRFDYFLHMGMREEMANRGYTGRLSPAYAIDMEPVDDPAGIGRYLTKWGIGQEVAGGFGKMGRNGVNMPYSAIPAVLSAELGALDPWVEAKKDRRVAQLVRHWLEFVDYAEDVSRKWYGSFHWLSRKGDKALVPELAGIKSRRDRIRICTEILPEELRPPRFDDGEDEDDEDEDAVLVEIDGEAWGAMQRVWHVDRLRLPEQWRHRKTRWAPAGGPALPLHLAVMWLLEDEGPEQGVRALADLVDAEARRDDVGWLIRFEHNGAEPRGLSGRPRDLTFA